MGRFSPFGIRATSCRSWCGNPCWPERRVSGPVATSVVGAEPTYSAATRSFNAARRCWQTASTAAFKIEIRSLSQQCRRPERSLGRIGRRTRLGGAGSAIGVGARPRHDTFGEVRTGRRRGPEARPRHPPARQGRGCRSSLFPSPPPIAQHYGGTAASGAINRHRRAARVYLKSETNLEGAVGAPYPI
jgi:hypothetical protein